MGQKYSKYWRKTRASQRILVLAGFLPSLLARMFPKNRDLSVFGSYNGALVGDNSLALYLQFKADGRKAFFITKNRSQCHVLLPDGSRPVFAGSLKGIWRQLTADCAYYSHAIFDFTSPLIMGAHIVCLQHGFPIKRGGAALDRGIGISRLKNFLKERIFPYSYYYFCNEVWSPPGVFAENTREVFRVGKPEVVLMTPPRLAGIIIQPKRREILFAPTHIQARSFRKRLRDWGLCEENPETLELIRRLSLKFTLRPHPIDAEEVDLANIRSIVSIDMSSNAHDLLGGYEAVITDVSSLGFDAIFLGIPARFLTQELDKFQLNEIGIFDSVVPKILAKGSDSLSAAISDLSGELDWGEEFFGPS